MPAIEIHVWGPAFGLPSINVECLATLAYLTQTLEAAEYTVIRSSPSAVPIHHLPALYNPTTESWTGGFSAIVSAIEGSKLNPRLRQTPSEEADAVAYSTFLSTHAAPLLALSLYVSSANWAGATRPAYSHILPFPLTWTEPPAQRIAHAARAEHLGLSSLDTDAESERTAAGGESVTSTHDKAGWIQVPASLRRARRVRDLLTPEQAAGIKLEGLADDVLRVVADAVERGALADRGAPIACLAYAHLALMLVPELPRPWLRNVMRTRYEGLCRFVAAFQAETRQKLQFLPLESSEKAAQRKSLLAIGSRFVSGSIGAIPGIGEEWQRWLTRRVRDVGSSRNEQRGDRSVVTGGAAVALLAASAGFYLCRYYPFGSPIHRFVAPRVGLGSLGAAGAMLGGMFDELD